MSFQSLTNLSIFFFVVIVILSETFVSWHCNLFYSYLTFKYYLLIIIDKQNQAV